MSNGWDLVVFSSCIVNRKPYYNKLILFNLIKVSAMDFKGFKDSGLYTEIVKLILGPEGLLKAGLHRLVNENDIADIRTGIVLCCRYNHPTLLRKLVSKTVIADDELFKLYCQYGCCDLTLFDELSSRISDLRILEDGIVSCCRYNHPALLQKLLTKINRRSFRLINAITNTIVDHPHLETIKVINAEERRFIWSHWNGDVLKSAVRSNNYQLIKFLIEETNLNQTQIWKAGYIAASTCSLDSFELLSSVMPNNYADFMFEAAVSGRSDIVRFILDSNQVISSWSIRNSIYYASVNKYFDIAKMISNKYPNISMHVGASIWSLVNGEFKLARDLLTRSPYIDHETGVKLTGMLGVGLFTGLFIYAVHKITK